MNEREEQDEAVIEQLRTALSADAVPASVTDFAKAALTWRRVDAELAELLSDSAVDTEPALARGGAVVRSVSFSAGETIIELEVHPDGDRGGRCSGSCRRRRSGRSPSSTRTARSRCSRDRTSSAASGSS